MTKWDARIEVFQDEKRAGWTHIRNMETDTLPRVGDRVSFWTDTASEELLSRVRLAVQDVPLVSEVHHMVGRESTEVVVTVRAELAPNTSPTDLKNFVITFEEGWTSAI